MLTAQSPAVILMHAVYARLEEVLPDRLALPDLKIRFARNRHTTRDERPCLAIAFVSDDPVNNGQISLSLDETLMALGLDLIVDLEIETESASETDATLLLNYDPSALDNLMVVLKSAALALRECTLDPLCDTTDVGKKVEWIEEVSVADDDQLPDNDGRLVGRINVLYRVSSWDPMVLLERE